LEKLFSKEKYLTRRKALKEKISSGLIFIPGNNNTPMNYAGNAYQFRQDSSFLYFFGLSSPELAGIIDVDSGEETLFGTEWSIDDYIWDGKSEKLEERAAKIGVVHVLNNDKLIDTIKKAVASGRKIHYLPPYRGERTIWLSELLDIPVPLVAKQASIELVKAVISLRSVKDIDEIQEIENTLTHVTSRIFDMAFKMAMAGVSEVEILAMSEGIALAHGHRMAYPVICSVNGQFLHNESYNNTLKEGDLLLLDAGSESPMHYATDITRTIPVSGKFASLQKEIYSLVLDMMQKAFELMKPGIPYSFVHRKVCETLADGLIALQLMKGNAEEIVNEGAHALFFPHGLGHLLGLDVHDMEDLGEEFTGYDDEFKRSRQFGTKFLRYAKKLLRGTVITVEPGIYFNPVLIDLWAKEKRFTQYINYANIEKYRVLGGIRIEDNVLITQTGNRILGNPIPKTLVEIENFKITV
jgi:Xaa-Pro aminopeptidase